MKARQFSVRSKLIGLSSVPVILLVVLTSLALYSVGLLLESVYQVDNTNKVIRQALEVQEDAFEMQTGMRGFLLTGSDKFLQEFVRGEKQIVDQMGSLKAGISDQEQARTLDQAEGVLSTWKKEVAAPAIALRKEIGSAQDMNDMSDLVREGVAQRHYVDLRSKMETFIKLQKSRLLTAQREQAREQDPVKLRWAMASVDFGNMVINEALQLLLLVDETQRAQLWYVLSGRDEYIDIYRKTKQKVYSMMDQLKESSVDAPDQVKMVDESRGIFNDWVKKILEPEISLREEIAKSKTMVDMKAYVNKGEDKIHFDKFKQLMEGFRKKEDDLMAGRQETADKTVSITRKLLVIGTVLVVLLASGITFLLSGRITQPLVGAVDLAESIGKGDLTKTLPVRTQDEVGRLCAALNDMVWKLQNQTKQILQGVNVLTASVAEISATVSQVAVSTTQTSTAVTETTTTISQLKQAARLASDKAKNVADSSRQAAQVSESGKEATEDTVRRMNLIKEQMESIGETVVRLSERSQAIEEIISTVQDLAAQSNLLAVNASIEAARAGEQGKGFAVVAHEIKTLADQSRRATEQVRSILEDTRKWVSAVVMATEQGSKAVDAGVLQSSTAGEAIFSLSNSVVASAREASVIQTTSEQQFTGVEQVATAMTSIENAVRQNSQGIAQIEEAAQRLLSLGEQLKKLVDIYKIA